MINNADLPCISFVIIGLNVEKFLKQSIISVMNSNYPSDKMEIIYVDSGSDDNSLKIAKSFSDVRVFKLGNTKPSAAKVRNLGYKNAKYDIIQFVDADSYLTPDWVITAIEKLTGNITAVAGQLTERKPNRNIFHYLANLEWNLRVGKSGWTTTNLETKSFGGNVMIKKKVLVEAGGYDETLAAGEDPDLSYRICKNGNKILRLNSLMATHDINIENFGQYWKRTKRSGYAYARLAVKHFDDPDRVMFKRLMRILVSVTIPFIVLFTGIFSGFPLTGFFVALLLVFRQTFLVFRFTNLFNIDLHQAMIYSISLSFAVYPQFLGVIQAVREKFIKVNNQKNTSGPDIFNYIKIAKSESSVE